MSNIFLASDPHFGHKGVTMFLNDDGSKLRPWDNTEEMDEALIERHNAVVRPQDKVYWLGDMVINRRAIPTIGRLNGTKILIKGNHDVFRLEEYLPYFKDIRGFGELAGFALSHVPIHPQSVGRWKGNIHGHLHSHSVTIEGKTWSNQFGVIPSGKLVIDPRYMCVSMEHINFTPISLEDAKIKFEAQQ